MKISSEQFRDILTSAIFNAGRRKDKNMLMDFVEIKAKFDHHIKYWENEPNCFELVVVDKEEKQHLEEFRAFRIQMAQIASCKTIDELKPFLEA